MDSKPKLDFTKGSFTRAHINNEFYNSKWEKFRTWYFKSFQNEELNYFVNTFYKFCEEQNEIIYYVPWFIKTFYIDQISVIEREYKLVTGNSQKSVYPPQIPFQIETNGKISFKRYYVTSIKKFDNHLIPIKRNRRFSGPNYSFKT